MSSELQRRVHARPLRELTESELDTIDTLSRVAVFNDEIKTGLAELGPIAAFELNERDFDRERR